MDLKHSITLASLAALFLSSCGSSENNEETEVKGLIDHSAKVEVPNYDLLKNAEDTVSYCLGLEAGSKLKTDYAGVDLDIFKASFTTNLNGEETDFSAEVADQLVSDYQGSEVHEVNDSLSYALGINLSNTINDKFPPLSVDVFMEGVKDEIHSKPLIISLQESAKLINKVSSQNFLDKNAEKPGVVTLPSGLQYKVLRKANGPSPAPGSEVTVHYEGTLVDGTVFDSSYERGQPASFPLTNVIKGWQEGIPLMQEGSMYEFYIPYYLGYGANGARSIPPYATLIFKVELMKSVK